MMKKYLPIPIVSLIFLLFFPCSELRAQETAGKHLIKIETSMGDMVIRLYDATPAHRDNMIKLIKEGFYKDQLFHRVIKDFMIQGGDPHSTGAAKGQRLGTGGPGYTVPAEFHSGLIHKKGALAAAREGDRQNPEQASSGSQFYIVQGKVFNPEEINILNQRGVASFTPESAAIYTSVGGTPHLDGSYTVFGEVIEGLDIIDLITSLSCDPYNRPVEDVIYSISLIK